MTWALNARIHQLEETLQIERERVDGLRRANSFMQWVLAVSLLLNIAFIAGTTL